MVLPFAWLWPRVGALGVARLEARMAYYFLDDGPRLQPFTINDVSASVMVDLTSSCACWPQGEQVVPLSQYFLFNAPLLAPWLLQVQNPGGWGMARWAFCSSLGCGLDGISP